MSVNPPPHRSRALGPPAASRRAVRGLRMRPPSGQPLPYPSTLLRYPTAVMFLLMREVFRLGQQRSARAGTPQEQMRFPHFATLACLEEFGPASQREISQRLRLDPSDLVGVVDWLQEAGFVRRRRDERDRRRYAVVLTPAGRRALRDRARVSDRMNAEVLQALGPDERKHLRELLLRALDGLERFDG